MDLNGGPTQDESHLALSHSQFTFSPAQIAQALLDYGASPNGGGEISSYEESKGKYHWSQD